MNYSALAQLQTLEKTYRPSQTISHTLGRKNLIMFVAPVACGKTFIMNHIVELDKRFGRVPVFTTREPRADDDMGMFRTLPHDEEHIASILQKVKAGTVVQYAVHPTSERVYGSEIQDYPAEYNMLATLSNVVEQMKQLPFQKVFIVGLVTRPEAWLSWFTKRYPKPNQEKQKRQQEALQSLTWLINNSNIIIWAENIDNQPTKTAHTIIDAILYNKREDKRALAEELFHAIKEMK
ncbi:MAG TPA: hypothetical protein VFT59_02140 [Candidatus Saccharimonadales bacterium]|nr:hypothetical protein [Candidatus Saccharimonadales bacterium]